VKASGARGRAPLSVSFLLNITWQQGLNFSYAGWILAAALSWSATAAAGERTLVAAKSDADYDALRSEAVKSGARILKDLRQIRLLVVDADRSSKAKLAASVHTQGTATDRIVRIVPDQMRKEFFGVGFKNPLLAARSGSSGKGKPPKPVTSDPGLSVPGLLWNLDRIEAPAAWRTTQGNPGVTVGVADTGLDRARCAPRGRARGTVFRQS
jgi:hypothetical protein